MAKRIPLLSKTKPPARTRAAKARKPSKASVKRAAKLRAMVLNPASVWG